MCTYILLAVEGEVCSNKKVTCEGAAGYVLYISLNLTCNLIENLQLLHIIHIFLVCSMFWCHSYLHSFRQHLQPLMIWNHHFSLHHTPASGKSLRREESNMKMPEIQFEKHVYGREHEKNLAIGRPLIYVP